MKCAKHTLIGNPAQRERGRRLAGEFLANYTVDLPFKRQSNAMVFLKNRGNVWFLGVKNRGMVYFRSNFQGAWQEQNGIVFLPFYLAPLLCSPDWDHEVASRNFRALRNCHRGAGLFFGLSHRPTDGMAAFDIIGSFRSRRRGRRWMKIRRRYLRFANRRGYWMAFPVSWLMDYSFNIILKAVRRKHRIRFAPHNNWPASLPGNRKNENG